MTPMKNTTFSPKLKELLEILFESQTIKPSYKEAHILYTIMILGENTLQNRGIGRYKIKEATGLGGGSVKTLINRLKEQKIISVADHKQNGHFLTEEGEDIFKSLIKIISIPQEIENHYNQFVMGSFANFSVVKNKFLNEKPKVGIAQRDASIKIGGTGATCLQYNGENLIFPDNPDEVFTVTIEKILNEDLQKNDYIVIGGGHNQEISKIATLAASLTLLE